MTTQNIPLDLDPNASRKSGATPALVEWNATRVVVWLPTEQKTIWIDLDNSLAHVPIFSCLLSTSFGKEGTTSFLLPRIPYQVRDLIALHGISCKVIGSHWGKNRALQGNWHLCPLGATAAISF